MYNHRLSEKQIAEMQGLKRYNYEPKQTFFDSLNMRDKVDANMLLAKMKRECGVNISSPVQVMHYLKTEDIQDMGEHVDYLKLQQYLKLKTKMWGDNYWADNLSELMEKLFNDFFIISGGDFIKTITLR